MPNAKKARRSKDETGDSIIHRAKRSNSSLSQLLSQQKETRQSGTFEEDEGFVFQRAKKRRTLAKEEPTKAEPKEPQKKVQKKPVKKPVKKEPVKKAKKAPKKATKPQEILLIDEMDQIETPERKLRNGKKSKTFNFSKQTKLEPQTLSPPISSSPLKKEYEEHHESIQMILPVSDSPINRRNKEFRGDRRSSLSNRGKRVSSIGNGFVAAPHDDVPLEEFYKHFDQSMPEPHKMRQLLIWSGKRVLAKEKKPKRKNVTAINIAKVIKQELIKDLSLGKLNTSWWNREQEVKKEVKMVPNAQNISNFQNLKVFEKRLEELKKEEEMWISLQGREVCPTKSPPELDQNADSLDQIAEKSQSVTEMVNEKLERSVDELSLFTHNLHSSSRCIGRYSRENLGTLSSIFRKENVPTRDLLRGISRMDAP